MNAISKQDHARIMYFSENQLRQAMTAKARQAIYKVLGGKAQVINRYICNVESNLRALGEHQIANQMIDDVIRNLLPH